MRVDDCIMKTESSVLERLISRFARGHIHINSLKCINGRLFINDIEVNDIREVVYVPEIWALINGWQYDETCSCWVRSNVKFKRMRGTILEIFDGKIYERLNVDNRVVVDVGAYIGDSTVYFALKGAKKVIAVEPHPVAYKELLENIKLNHLEDIVISINAALSTKPGVICIEGVDVEDTARAYHKLHGQGLCTLAVQAITLGEILSKYTDSNDVVLKMDCEGCEYDVILNDYDHVKMFKEVMLEYHTYSMGISLQSLLKILARDYLCKIIEVGYDTGLIHCIKR